MQKQAWTWTTPHLLQPARMARWGHYGIPVLIAPTAGGDFEEIERFQLVAALDALIEGGRIKVYSVDALAARAWLAGNTSAKECLSLEERYDTYLYEDVLQRIRTDCQDESIEPILVGASLGAATAIWTVCRHPDAFRSAFGLSGIYESGNCCRPLDSAPSVISYVSSLAGPQLSKLRERMVVLGSGAGDYENPDDSKRLSDAFQAKGIPCRFNSWGPARGHTWSTWREQLPGMLAEGL